jgi:hypothetical protein
MKLALKSAPAALVRFLAQKFANFVTEFHACGSVETADYADFADSKQKNLERADQGTAMVWEAHMGRDEARPFPSPAR